MAPKVTAPKVTSMSPRYAVGIDFGTESARALLVDVADGREIATSVYPYANGVIDERLPDSNVWLDPDWALQDPADYIVAVKRTVPAVLRQSGVDAGDVIGLGIAFTASTLLPATSDGMPLCQLPHYRQQPHACVKLWKHHAAQAEADRINEIARQRSEPWLPFYGGKISSESFFSKALQILNEAPAVYHAADCLIEAGDWIVWQLTGHQCRNSCAAGYKALWQKDCGFPSQEYFATLHPQLADVVDRKMQREISPWAAKPVG